MKKLIDISKEYLHALDVLAKHGRRSAKKHLEFIIHEELLNDLSRCYPAFVGNRNEIINKIYDVIDINSDNSKKFKFDCYTDNIANYVLKTKKHTYRLDVDSYSILPKLELKYIVYPNDTHISYINFTCVVNETEEEIKYSHNGCLLAMELMKSRGIKG